MKIVLVILLSIPLTIISAQVHKVYSEAPIVINNGIKESTQITVKFRNKTFELNQAKPEGDLDLMLPGYNNLSKFLQSLQNKYGKLTFRKVIPEAVWGDTTYYDPSRHVSIKLPDLSQIYKIKFSQFVPIDSIISSLKQINLD
jgi:hypothetical protein